MLTIFEAGVEVLLLLLLLNGFQTLLGGFVLLGGGVSIDYMHFVNTVHPLHPKIYDEEIPLCFSLVLRRRPSEFVLPSSHGVTCVDFGVVTHMRGDEGLARKVDNPITELIMTHLDEASLLSVEGVVDSKFCSKSIAMFRKVRGVDDVVQEEGIPPLLRP